MGVCASSSVTGDVVPSQPPSTVNVKPVQEATLSTAEDKAPNPELLENPQSSVWDGEEIWDGEQDWQQDESGNWATDEPSLTQPESSVQQEGVPGTTPGTHQQDESGNWATDEPSLTQPESSVQQEGVPGTTPESHQQQDPETPATNVLSRQESTQTDAKQKSEEETQSRSHSVSSQDLLKTGSSALEADLLGPGTAGGPVSHSELAAEGTQQGVQKDQEIAHHRGSQREDTHDTEELVLAGMSDERTEHHKQGDEDRPMSADSKQTGARTIGAPESADRTGSDIAAAERNEPDPTGQCDQDQHEEHLSQHSLQTDDTERSLAASPQQKSRPQSRDLARNNPAAGHEESNNDPDGEELY